MTTKDALEKIDKACKCECHCKLVDCIFLHPKKCEHCDSHVDCEACKWRESEIGYYSPCPKHQI